MRVVGDENADHTYGEARRDGEFKSKRAKGKKSGSRGEEGEKNFHDEWCDARKTRVAVESYKKGAAVRAAPNNKPRDSRRSARAAA